MSKTATKSKSSGSIARLIEWAQMQVKLWPADCRREATRNIIEPAVNSHEELVAVLRSMTKYLTGLTSKERGLFDCDQWHEVNDAYLAPARAALAKAEGSNP